MIFWNAPGEVAFAELLQVVCLGLKEVVSMRLEKAVRRGSGEAKLVISCRTVLGKKLSMGRANTIESPTHIGDSISVNDVCLTVTELKSDTFIADVMPETF